MQSRDSDRSQDVHSMVLAALDALVGTEVDLISDFGTGRKVSSGTARWRAERAGCATAFLQVGENAGIPVGSHRVGDFESVAGGVRWSDSLGSTHLVVPRGAIEQEAMRREEPLSVEERIARARRVIKAMPDDVFLEVLQEVLDEQ